MPTKSPKAKKPAKAKKASVKAKPAAVDKAAVSASASKPAKAPSKLSSVPTVMSSLRYADAGAAIDFLVKGLGFTQHSRFNDADGKVMHAELVRGTGMIMLGTEPPKAKGQKSKSEQVRMDLGPAAI